MMAVLVITGMPATGKSTICRHVSKIMGFPVLEKDSIKECLFDTVGFSCYAEKRKLDHAANAVLIKIAKEMIESGVSFIIDNNFDDKSGKALSELVENYNVPVVSLVLKCDIRTAYERYAARDNAGKRHLGHVLQNHYPPEDGDDLSYTMSFQEFCEKFLTRGMDSFESRGKRIEVDTSDFRNVDLDDITAKIIDSFR